MRIVIALWMAASLFAGYRLALPGYRFQFPRDHFSHPEFQTEWWYYTGNVHTAGGRRFGFELVFFRQGQRLAEADIAAVQSRSAWRIDDLYLAHLALTDIDGRRFVSRRRLNRAGPGIAGVDEKSGRIWNGNWVSTWDAATDVQTLSAVAEGIRLQLRLTPRTPVVIHGTNGVSQTGEGAGHAAYYTSFPLMEAGGAINGAAVDGTAWMDHEWFTNLLEPAQQGWDWFSIQLENHTELMLFQIRRADGGVDAHSSGTWVGPGGRAVSLSRTDFDLQPLEYWRSPKTGARYPVKWRIAVPRLKLALDCAAALPEQELVSDGAGPAYWEGAVSYTGSARGVGYLEMTGYAPGR